MGCYQKRAKNTCLDTFPRERRMEELKQQEERERDTRVFLPQKKGQAGGARQTLTHAHAEGVIHFSGPTAPTLHSALCKTGTW